MPRQQSLTATIDWSYRLLSEAEQDLFARLSVFAGGFDIDAAHGVCGEEGTDEDDTLELLTGLIDKSMVTVRWRNPDFAVRHSGDLACIRTGSSAGEEP